MTGTTAPLPLDPLPLLLSLLRFDSVSARSNLAITDRISDILAQLGFQLERSAYIDHRGITKANLVATRPALRSTASEPSGQQDPIASGRGGVAYFAHTDVVPADPWDGPGEAFAPVVQDNRVYARGSCDMKGSLVAMITAASRIDPRQQTAPITIVCTADEEVGFVGAKHLVASSPAYRRLVQTQPLAIIGEPTRCEVVHAHKGIEAFTITSRGRAAHSSSRAGHNANIAMVPMLVELLRLNELSETDPQLRDERFDPPTLSWNFGVSDHCTAVNITPARTDAWFSLRTMPGIDGQALIAAVRAKAEQLGLELEHCHGGPPLWVDPASEAVRTTCELAGCAAAKTICYATDGGEFTQLDKRLVCGPGDIAQAHTSDEWLALDQLHRGIDLYHGLLLRWCV
jgi:acetylornithine deacetylase